MQSYTSRSVENAARRLAAVFFLSLAAAGAALAQAPAGAGAPDFKNPKGDTDAQTNREATIRSAELNAAVNQLNQQRLAVVIEQTKQDFKRIQLIRNEMVDNLVAKKPLDYKLVSEQAAEINKRANRLKSFLMRPATEGEKKDESRQVEDDGEPVKGALAQHCNPD